MSEQEPHKLDETFRTMIERMSFEPPTTNLDTMRANVLQMQLGRLQTENGWLKAALGIVMLLLGSTGYVLLKENAPVQQKSVVQQILKVKQTDTVYITRTERVYIRVPIPESIDDGPDLAQNHHEEPDNQFNTNKNPKTLPNEETATLHPKIGVHKNRSFDSKNIVKNNESDNPKHSIFNSQPLSQNLNRRKQAGKVESYGQNMAKNQALTENIVPPTADLKYTPEALMGAENNLLNLDFLEPLNYSNVPHLNIPKIHYKSKNQSTAKPKKPRQPFSERLSLSAYYAPELNKLNLRRDNIDAFEFGHESITSTQVAGMRVGIKLSDKLNLLTGLEHQTIRFEHSGLSKETLIAQDINGQPTFFKKTVFGIAQIPGDSYTSNPAVGSRVVLESDEDNFVQFLRIPLAFSYDFYRQKLHWFEQRNTNLKLYALVGGYWATPTKQQMKVEIYEPDGHDFYTTLTHFQNTSANIGLNVGLGAEIRYGQHWSVFGEPYYQTGIKSMVQNLPLRTFVGGFGCRFGLKYQLKK
ncbi:hypothetical protein [Runella aurantiaca]|uniref:Outer membrane protein beta-barrel domain-containing protein n=1 Tax=Runella aurantiaca TaxID=2282308 RepID=A0A369HZ76_9BACT|nr:hypothetical protein [Runella aurantiaca]RDB02658.1 hypothetical protein DVG78_27545 [Runella aurantiaca]